MAFGDGVEEPFENQHWDNYTPGVYKTVASGKVVFSSKDKFDNKDGFCSFSKPAHDAPIKVTEET